MCSISKLIKELGRMPTKNEIAFEFPDLRKYLFRENTDFENLQQWLLNFVMILKKRSFKMKNKEEYKYEDENKIDYAK